MYAAGGEDGIIEAPNGNRTRMNASGYIRSAKDEAINAELPGYAEKVRLNSIRKAKGKRCET